jgi:photosystem I subunit PsaO
LKKVESSLLCVELQWRRVQSCYLRLFFGVSIFVCVCFAGIVSEVMAATMATMAVTTPVVAGLGGSSLRRRAASPSKVQLTSAFVSGDRSCSLMTPSLQLGRPLCMSRVTCFNRDWLRKDLSVVGFGLIGWLAPSSIPVINGNSLTGLFLASIGPELAHFPTGPSLTSPFWLWLITWHLGLFIVLTLGQIGFKGRKDGYWES